MPKTWKVYTKTGDKGETSLLGGKRVPKYDNQIETYGTIDELNSWIGLLAEEENSAEQRSLLVTVCSKLFVIGSYFAAADEVALNKMSDMEESDILSLENAIDNMNNSLPDLLQFVLPLGNRSAANCHIARTVCRRAERRAIKYHQENPKLSTALKYLNRLSDYLFVLARYRVISNGDSEILWRG